MKELSSLYQEAIRHHAADPVGYRQSITATHQNEIYNPQCGDRILVQLRIIGDTVEAAAFDGEACAICLASASLLCEHTPGHPVDHLAALHSSLCSALEGDPENSAPDDLKPLLGVKPYPSRIRCATLPWSAALGAL